MKRATIIIICISVCLILLGAVLGGIGWSISADPLAELSHISISSTHFSGGRDLDSAFHADGAYTASADVTGLDVNWVAGSVTLQPYDGEEIRFSETADEILTEQTALRWGIEDGTLYIQYCQNNPGLDLPDKDLEIMIPAELALQSLNLGCTSADLSGQDLQAAELDVSTVSGGIRLSGMTCGDVCLASTSGQIDFTGAAQTIEAGSTSGRITVAQTGDSASLCADTTSGNVTLTGTYSAVTVDTDSGWVAFDGDFAAEQLLVNTTSGDVSVMGTLEEVEIGTVSGEVSVYSAAPLLAVEINTTSGDVVLTIPDSSGFTLQYDTVSGSLDCQLPLQIEGDSRFVCGDGEYAFCVDTTSGDLKIAAP